MNIRLRVARWVVRKFGGPARQLIVPRNCTLYVPEPSLLEFGGITVEDGATLIYGPPPEPNPLPWRAPVP